MIFLKLCPKIYYLTHMQQKLFFIKTFIMTKVIVYHQSTTRVVSRRVVFYPLCELYV